MTQTYSTDDSLRTLLDKIDFVILPVLNVDGYAYIWINPVKLFYCESVYHSRLFFPLA